MRKMALAAVVATAVVGLPLGAVAVASSNSSAVTTARTLHLTAPVKGSITEPTSDLTTFRGPVTDRAGHRMGHLQGYCVTIEDKSGLAECTTTIFLSGGQITLVGPTHNRQSLAHFRQAVAGGTGYYQNARGQADLTLRRNNDVDYDVQLLP